MIDDNSVCCDSLFTGPEVRRRDRKTARMRQSNDDTQTLIRASALLLQTDRQHKRNERMHVSLPITLTHITNVAYNQLGRCVTLGGNDGK